MFSKPCKYALRATLLLGREATEDDKLSVQQIADILDIPKHYLAKILQQLSKHNLISSVKGPNGGFYLSTRNMKKSMMQVIECIDGDDSLTSCILGLPKCSDQNPCSLHEQIVDWRRSILHSLATKTIEDAVRDATENNYAI